jgi:hypothetical protein
MKSLFDYAQDYLESVGWDYLTTELRDLIRFPLTVEGGKLDCFLRINEAQQMLIFFALYPIAVPEKRRLAVAELICRANYGLNLGNFEMDFADGELRFRTTHNTDGGCINAEVVRHLIYGNLHTMEKYLPAILAVAFAGHAPTIAIAGVEGFDTGNQLGTADDALLER